MKKLMRGAAALLAGWLATSTPIIFAQDFASGEPNLPLPLYHARPDAGGFFMSGSFAMYRQTNPIKSQTVAYRGFYAIDGTNLGPQSISGTGTSSTIVASDSANNAFIGSMSDALNTQQVSGPSSYMPGFKVEGGWKFADESSLTMSYLWLAKANYASTASLIPPNLNISANGADGYISSPV